MAERIVSPGVFTREKDLSFLPQGIGEIGAALIGQSIKGPAFVPTKVESFNEYQQKFGGLSEDSYLPYTAQAYLQDAGTATIVRVLGASGYIAKPIALMVSSSAGNFVAAVLHGSTTYGNVNDLDDSIVTGVSASAFLLTLSGSDAANTSSINTSTSASLNPSDANYLTKIYGYAPKSSKDVYTQFNFSTFQSASFATGEVATTSVVKVDVDYGSAYSEASTPWIKSQKVGGTATNLFKLHTLSHGNPTNYEFKVGISNIKPASEVPGSEYGTFTVSIRRVDTGKIPNSIFGQNVQDSDTRPNIVEEFQGVNLDPNSPNYIKRIIGDKYITVDANGKLTSNGDYPNASAHIRVSVNSDVEAGSLDASLVPFGFGAVTSPLHKTYNLPSPTYNVSQSVGGEYNKRTFLGYSYDFTSTDNLNFLSPLPVVDDHETVGSDFDLATCKTGNVGSETFITLTSVVDAKKFMVPFQGGFDGWEPNRVVNNGSAIVAGNSQGLDMSSVTSAGTVAMRKAINSVSNPDEFDINMIVLPGVINRLHSSVSTFAKDMCEDRQDCFYVMDAGAYSDSIATAVNSLTSFDSNYVATYHPWVKILDVDKNKPVWVPPSVVLPGVIAFNDSVAAEWYAPAGLNRGGLSNVIEVKTRLTHDERDTLYTGRINPIATFPGQGATVFGQKTLQAKPSALDRINVRRLMIAVKKYIASSTRYLVFENNTAATRNRFLSIVNPYLESIQQRNGLYAFRVVMDDTNNTPDVIDRNMMVGEIYLQPAKTAEFIVLDFNILPTGAAFPEA